MPTDLRNSGHDREGTNSRAAEQRWRTNTQQRISLQGAEDVVVDLRGSAYRPRRFWVLAYSEKQITRASFSPLATLECLLEIIRGFRWLFEAFARDLFFQMDTEYPLGSFAWGFGGVLGQLIAHALSIATKFNYFRWNHFLGALTAKLGQTTG